MRCRGWSGDRQPAVRAPLAHRKLVAAGRHDRPEAGAGGGQFRVAANCQSVAPQRYASSTPLTQARSGVAAAGRSAQRGAEMDERVPTLKFGGIEHVVVVGDPKRR